MKHIIAILAVIAFLAPCVAAARPSLLGESYDSCVSTFGAPTGHDGTNPPLDKYYFEKDGWKIQVCFFKNIATIVAYQKSDETPLSGDECDRIASAYGVYEMRGQDSGLSSDGTISAKKGGISLIAISYTPRMLKQMFPGQ